MAYHNKENKTWVARWQIDGVRKSKSGFIRKKYAEMYEAQQKLNHEKNLVGIETDGEIEIDQLFQSFIATVDVRESTLVNKKIHAECWIKFFDSVNVYFIHEVGRAHIVEYITKREKKGTAKNSIGNEITILKQVIDFAIDSEMLNRSPIEKWPKIIVDSKNDLPRFLNVDELKVLEELSYKKNVLFADMIAILVRTGLRIGELVTLEPKHIDFDRKQILLESANTKSGYQRVVPINARVEEILSEHIAKAKKHKNKYIFHKDKKEQVSRKSIWWFIKNVAKDLGLEDINVHTLRKTFISLCIMEGDDPIRVMAIVGHQNYSTMKKYLAFSPKYVLKPPKLPFE